MTCMPTNHKPCTQLNELCIAASQVYAVKTRSEVAGNTVNYLGIRHAPTYLTLIFKR